MSTETEKQSESNLPQNNLTFVERLAERIGLNATARSVYANPVERDGVTIIPVAKVRYGFGGGGQQGKEQVEGGGAGVQVSPVGYIELKDGHSKFKRIRNPLAALPFLASGLMGFLIMRRVLRTSSKCRPEDDRAQ